MAHVSIVTYTGHGHPNHKEFAGRLLAFTKATRLQMTPSGFADFMAKPWADIEKELAYMATTIASSWEFASITFALTGVSRAAAQQITRTRVGVSFAMQSQRVTDMSQVTVEIAESMSDTGKLEFAKGVNDAISCYKRLVDAGEKLEDARGILPINTHCNLIAQYNLRSLVDLLRSRDSLRVQGEYHDIALQMKKLCTDIWPWSAPFFVPRHQQAINIIEAAAKVAGGSASVTFKEIATSLAKAADLLKKD
jgi:flavin-dependent thymidylate synthase